MFTSRAELLDKEETTDEHKKNHQEEIDRLDKDKANEDPSKGGLFGGLFKKPPPLKPIVDVEDGVVRCPECSWELDSESFCVACGYREGEELSDYTGTDLSETDYDGSAIFDEDDDFEDAEEDMDLPSYMQYRFPGSRFMPPLSGAMAERFFGIHPGAWRPEDFVNNIPSLDTDGFEYDGYGDEPDDYEMDSFIDDEDPGDDDDLGSEGNMDSDHSTVVGSERNRQVPVIRYPDAGRRPQEINTSDNSGEDLSDEDDYSEGPPRRMMPGSLYPYYDDEDEDEDEDEEGEDDDEEGDEIESDSEDDTPHLGRRAIRRSHHYVPDSISPAPDEESEAASSSSPPRRMHSTRVNGASVQDAIAIEDSDDEQPVGPVRRTGQRRQPRYSPY